MRSCYAIDLNHTVALCHKWSYILGGCRRYAQLLLYWVKSHCHSQMEQHSRCRRHAQLLLYWFKLHCHSLQERLDFSCAMFGPDGGLVANAPHIPVHLGSMQETVQYQVEYNYFLLTFHMGMLFHYISVRYTVTQHGVAFFQDSHIRRWSEGRWRHT